MPVRRGRMYLYCASSTCSWPSRVRARWAKMSRMRPERSSTRTPSSSLSTRICEGESSLSKTARSQSLAAMSSFISRTLPSPRKLRGSGAGRFCSSIAAVSPPAVSTRAASSSIEISVERSAGSMLSAARPASTARSFFLSVVSISLQSVSLRGRGAHVLQGPRPRLPARNPCINSISFGRSRTMVQGRPFFREGQAPPLRRRRMFPRPCLIHVRRGRRPRRPAPPGTHTG